MLTHASQLYAISQGASGIQETEALTEQCYWCDAPCGRDILHSEPPPIPFTRHVTSAKKVSSPYMCRGCWLFRRNRVTVNFLNGGFRDGQNPAYHSWFITSGEAKALRYLDYDKLYDLLLHPPQQFVLTILSDGILSSGRMAVDQSTANLIHRASLNDFSSGLTANTPIAFTFNNQPMTYTIYELEHALSNGNGSTGKEPGVLALTGLLGPHSIHKENGNGQPEERKEKGRPKGHGEDKEMEPVRKVTRKV